MTFTAITAKEHGKKGNEMKAKYKKDRMDYIASGGLNKSLVLLDEMLNGNPNITDDQKEAVNILLKFLPYSKPQLSRTEVKEEIDQNITIKWE